MLKRIVLTIICMFLLGNIVFAHGGSTDEDGGHTDRSTGDYHYHHGYPAHDHEDLDGDGKVDCPYDFDDQTDHSSHSGGSGKTSSTTGTDNRRYSSAVENLKAEKAENDAIQAAKEKEKRAVYAFGVTLCFAAVALFFIIPFKRK